VTMLRSIFVHSYGDVSPNDTTALLIVFNHLRMRERANEHWLQNDGGETLEGNAERPLQGPHVLAGSSHGSNLPALPIFGDAVSGGESKPVHPRQQQLLEIHKSLSFNRLT
jgi:hypothetical protein